MFYIELNEIHAYIFLIQIVLPPHLERIREKLAENSHELWAVNRIEQGWTYGMVGFWRTWHIICVEKSLLWTKRISITSISALLFLYKFRDDNKKMHPCLVDFQSLPEPEKNYNLAMSGETLKYVKV